MGMKWECGAGEAHGFTEGEGSKVLPEGKRSDLLVVQVSVHCVDGLPLLRQGGLGAIAVLHRVSNAEFSAPKQFPSLEAAPPLPSLLPSPRCIHCVLTPLRQ